MTVSPAPPVLPGELDRIREEINLGILTALPIEGAAMESLIDDVRLFTSPEDPRTYRIGTLPSSDAERPHRVALAVLSQDGTWHAAAACADLLRTFPHVRCVVMAGIAGGIPRVTEPARHVRLGDVVVADQLIEYGAYRQDGDSRRPRRPAAGMISSRLRRAAVELQVEVAKGRRPWERWLDPARTEAAGRFRRPADGTDVLEVRDIPVPHPDRALSGHTTGLPKVHYGAVGSADVLMRDEGARDELAAEHRDLVAFEMEASGIAAGTAEHELSWYMVRGIADYSARGKNDLWHPYASFAAAAYLRALLAVAQPAPRLLPQVPRDQRDEIGTLLRRLPAGLDLRRAWPAPVDLPASLAGATPVHAFDYLAGRNVDADGLACSLMLVEAFAGRAEPGLAAQLRSWVDRQAAAMDAADALARWRARPPEQADEVDARPCLLVEIEAVGIDRQRCLISAYLQDRAGPWRPRRWPGEPVEARLGDAARVVGEMLDRAEREEWRTSDTKPGIEFLLPLGLVNLPVEWWSPRGDARDAFPLCVDYAVVVRSVERMRRFDRPRLWGSRWRVLHQVPFQGRVLHGVNPRDEDELRQWEIGLHAGEDVVAVVLSSPPDQDPGAAELARAIVQGVPVVLWDHRATRPGDAAAHLGALAAEEPPELRTRIGKLRLEAAASPQHPGRFVALLWDNPHRLVTVERGAA